jgi:hypothetical protein
MKKQLTIEKFCDKNSACADGKEWATQNCKTMTGAWEKLKPEWLIWVAARDGVLTDRELRLFSCWSLRQVWHLLADERSKHAVEVAERYAEGKATESELAAAWAAAWAEDSAWAAAGDARAAARAAAWAARDARDAARAAREARAAARDAAGAAAWDARAAARDAASAAAWNAAGAAQAAWLREHATPCFAAGRGEG